MRESKLDFRTRLGTIRTAAPIAVETSIQCFQQFEVFSKPYQRMCLFFKGSPSRAHLERQFGDFPAAVRNPSAPCCYPRSGSTPWILSVSQPFPLNPRYSRKVRISVTDNIRKNRLRGLSAVEFGVLDVVMAEHFHQLSSAGAALGQKLAERLPEAVKGAALRQARPFGPVRHSAGE